MDSPGRRKADEALIEDAAEIARQREARYRAELAAMAIDQVARIKEIDDRDRRTLRAILDRIADIKVTVQETGGAPAIFAPAPADLTWEIAILSPVTGLGVTLPNESTDTYLAPVNVRIRLVGPETPTALAAALAGRVYFNFGDGAAVAGPIAPDLDDFDYAGGAYVAEVAFGVHAWYAGNWALTASVNGPLAGSAGATSALAVNDYEPPPPPPTRYACVAGVCVESATGPYASLEACQAVCAAPPPRWDYVGGVCVQAANGPYASLSECEAAHPPPPPPQKVWYWNSKLMACTIAPAGFGDYYTQAECEAAHPPYVEPPPAPTGSLISRAPSQDQIIYLPTSGQTTVLVYLTMRVRLPVPGCAAAQLAAMAQTAMVQIHYESSEPAQTLSLAQATTGAVWGNCAGGFAEIDLSFPPHPYAAGSHIPQVLIYDTFAAGRFLFGEYWYFRVLHQP